MPLGMEPVDTFVIDLTSSIRGPDYRKKWSIRPLGPSDGTDPDSESCKQCVLKLSLLGGSEVTCQPKVGNGVKV